MTREEAIKRMEICRNFLANNYSDMGEPNFTAFNMAIEALEQLTSYEQTINKLTKAISEQEPCEDAISRQEVLNQIFYSTDNSGDVVLGSVLRRRIENLPSVKPQETKTGHWIEVIDEIDSLGNKTWHHKCSICGNEDSGWGNYKYCPNCGARMENEEC